MNKQLSTGHSNFFKNQLWDCFCFIIQLGRVPQLRESKPEKKGFSLKYTDNDLIIYFNLKT